MTPRNTIILRRLLVARTSRYSLTLLPRLGTSYVIQKVHYLLKFPKLPGLKKPRTKQKCKVSIGFPLLWDNPCRKTRFRNASLLPRFTAMSLELLVIPYPITELSYHSRDVVTMELIFIRPVLRRRKSEKWNSGVWRIEESSTKYPNSSHHGLD